jgi:hypothetical protein
MVTTSGVIEFYQLHYDLFAFRSGDARQEYTGMRDIVALSFGSILSILLALMPLATGVRLPDLAQPYPQCFPNMVTGIAPKPTLLHDCNGSLFRSPGSM